MPIYNSLTELRYLYLTLIGNELNNKTKKTDKNLPVFDEIKIYYLVVIRIEKFFVTRNYLYR